MPLLTDLRLFALHVIGDADDIRDASKSLPSNDRAVVEAEAQKIQSAAHRLLALLESLEKTRH